MFKRSSYIDQYVTTITLAVPRSQHSDTASAQSKLFFSLPKFSTLGGPTATIRIFLWLLWLNVIFSYKQKDNMMFQSLLLGILECIQLGLSSSIRKGLILSFLKTKETMILRNSWLFLIWLLVEILR